MWNRGQPGEQGGPSHGGTARHEVTTARCPAVRRNIATAVQLDPLFWIRAVLNRSSVMFWTGFSSVLLLVSRSDLQRISSTIGVSARHSLPVFRPRSVKDSGALRRSGATGTNFGTYCILLTPVKRQQKITVGEMRQSGPTRLKPRNARALRGLWCRAGNGPHARPRLSICSETKQNDERLILILSIPAWADRNRNRLVDSRTYRARII